MANSDIQAELSRSENQIELLQNENKALKEGIQDRSLAIRQLEDALSSQEMESRSLKADLSRLEDDQMKSLYNLRDRHESERLKQAAYYEEKLHSFQDDHDQELLRNEKFLKDRHDQHERELSNQKAMHEETIHTLYEEHKREFSKQESKHQKTLQDLRDKHALDVAKEKQEAKAMSEETGDSIRQLTDSELKIQFQKLKLLVQVITEPFNLGAVSVPQDSQLDHTGFIQRKGKNMLRFLLRSLVWERIVDGFFSAPFGFGAFGSGDGKRVLIELYWSWRSLFAHHGGAGAGTGTGSLDIFSRSKDANRWRSATFSSIMSAVRDAKKSPVDGDEPAPLTPYAMNQAKVETDILKVFEEITTAEAVDQIKDKVSEIACLAGELALEVGVHRANVGLLLLSSGESVQIGQDFVDCEDGHGAQGDLETVDLLVCPQLFKIGDGRGEGSPSTPKSICPGEVYPVRFMPA
ncbi:hypothetical protein B0T22DRAFT_376643 [Podospora appendiculata]|uniref:Uncharacterized protein n=1 Tax=Podospora appendiculata TaxID=314037 RepID=A0AAE1CCR0_9PEZI|nr:hypothetical protein B0T22DRAFT_376643 [Podospora appendiculata]